MCPVVLISVMPTDNNHKPLKILFITQDDPFYVRLFFEEFFKHCKSLDEIAAVVIAHAMGKKSYAKLARQMYDFYGPVNFTKMGTKYALRKILVHLPDAFRKNGGFNLAQLCGNYEIPVIYESKINSTDFLTRVKGMNIDLIISVAAPVIFKKDIIQLPTYGCINIHHAPLPKYRGMMPNFWQMYHDEKRVGMTIHEINPKIDDGRIILQKEVDIAPGETLDTLIKRTKRIGAHLMIEAIEMIRSGKVKYLENRADEGTYFSFPKREDVREFKRRGKRII
jgi:methionyl-tRNA formyltransferase